MSVPHKDLEHLKRLGCRLVKIKADRKRAGNPTKADAERREPGVVK